MNNERIVKKIQITDTLPFSPLGTEHRKKRVAAYARVSTDSDEQLSSYEAQVRYYTNHIKNNPAWEFVSVYTDEGITGTSTKRRDGFNRMVQDALGSKIDLIITKSVSRFARNTVDSLTTVRKLKAKGVEVYFEKENIYTLDSKGELFITIMSSLAQEESRSISENVTWGKRKSMEDGRISLPYKQFLGYEKGENDLPRIVESEAEIVREIYTLFLEGKAIRTIARILIEQGVPTPRGKKQWSVSTITSILTNEKYKGAALLQKTYTLDFLTKTIRKNQGNIPQYYIEDSHPAIISPEIFDRVQDMLKKTERKRRIGSSPFAAKIICGECGGFYGSKVWHSADKYRTLIWQCNRKYKDKTFCTTPHLREEVFKEAFVTAFNQILGDKPRYIREFEALLPLLADTSELQRQLEEALTQKEQTETELRRCIEENTRAVQNQAEYTRSYNELAARLTAIRDKAVFLNSEISELVARKENIRRFLDELKATGDILETFDEALWNATADYITVWSETKLTVTFRDGTEISVEIPKGKRAE